MLKQQFLTGRKRKSVCIIRTGVTGHACEHHFKYIGNLGLESWLNTNQCNLQSLKIKLIFQNSTQGGLKIHHPVIFFFFLNKRSAFTDLGSWQWYFSAGLVCVWSEVIWEIMQPTAKSLPLVCTFAVLYKCSRARGEEVKRWKSVVPWGVCPGCGTHS